MVVTSGTTSQNGQQIDFRDKKPKEDNSRSRAIGEGLGDVRVFNVDLNPLLFLALLGILLYMALK